VAEKKSAEGRPPSAEGREPAQGLSSKTFALKPLATDLLPSHPQQDLLGVNLARKQLAIFIPGHFYPDHLALLDVEEAFETAILVKLHFDAIR